MNYLKLNWIDKGLKVFSNWCGIKIFDMIYLLCFMSGDHLTKKY